MHTGKHCGTDAGRRRFLAWSALALAAGWSGFPGRVAAFAPGQAQPAPAGSVRLLPSVFADQVSATRGYLMRLSADRLLHNFREQAGLAPRAEVYGGWESDTIAGHTLGHYLSALSLMHAGSGDAECRARADYIVAELRACQVAGGDGYVGGFTRKRADGTIEPGRVVLDELARGDIRPLPFDLNGSWAPFYTWHKLFAGLLDAHRHCGNADALEVAVGVAGYLEAKLAPLDHAQMQHMLDCEFGGMPESLAELAARTGERRWAALAQRFVHARVLDPLELGEDRLNRLHANTQIPKLLGAARLYEVQGRREDAAAAQFFWQRVTGHHSYAIGGNSDREYFQAPGTLSSYVTEQTCEHCNTLNMLRLGRYLYGWSGDAAYFEFHERALYNHILSQQHPEGGRYSYMTPLMTGEARAYSEPEGEFWCCVGTGMESHAQFSQDIYWFDGDVLSVNLYIPSTLEDAARGLSLRMTSALPDAGAVRIELAVPGRLRGLRLRMPGWSSGLQLLRNGKPVQAEARDGYVHLEGPWQAGDRLELAFEMPWQLEPCGDDAQLVSLRRGPCVLAADLGPADQPWDGVEPWLPSQPLEALLGSADAAGRWRAQLPSHPQGLEFAPFHALHERRHAVYFRRFDAASRQAWEREQSQLQAATEALDRASIDQVVLGDEASERAHGLESGGRSHALSYRRKPGRDARTGGFFAFRMRGEREARALRLRYWGAEHRRRFSILVNGVAIAHEVLAGERGDDFVDVDYPLPATLRQPVSGGWQVRIEPEAGYSAGPVFGAWLLG